MRESTNCYLISCGVIALLGGLLHIAMIFGGPRWYWFFGAPPRIVQMARAGVLYPAIFCLVVAALLLLCATYAFSGAGVFRRLPLLRAGLSLIGWVFILRGIVFIPLAVWRPEILARVCNSYGIDSFLVVTSVISLGTGIGYVLGAREAGRRSINDE
ncbi:MAG TPA: hypothetical protein VLO30_00720 [Chthoniobacterales bacterium]|nr:hypothetical protein [Chthoniobacterales bacterium]